jgi:hypothetical protein
VVGLVSVGGLHHTGIWTGPGECGYESTGPSFPVTVTAHVRHAGDRYRGTVELAGDKRTVVYSVKYAIEPDGADSEISGTFVAWGGPVFGNTYVDVTGSVLLAERLELPATGQMTDVCAILGS